MQIGKHRIIIAVLAVITAFVLSGCSINFTNGDSLLKAPKLGGEMLLVQNALDSEIGGKYILKYPSKGDYKSAISFVDVTGDGISEAVVFYAVSEKSTSVLHIALLSKENGKYKIIADGIGPGNAVECLKFCDLNGDNSKEIAVGWNVFSNTTKQLFVYSTLNAKLTPVFSEGYSEFTVSDLNNDLFDDLFLINSDVAKSEAYAKSYAYDGEAVSEIGTCKIDGNITSREELVMSKLASGKNAVLIDSIKGGGVQTEIIYFEDGNLKNPIFEEIFENADEKAVTYRTESIFCTDIDNDGFAEIPSVKLLPTTDFTTGKMAAWSVYDTTGFITESYSAFDETNNKFLVIPPTVALSCTFYFDKTSHSFMFYNYDYENGKLGEFAFKVTATRDADETENKILISETDGLYYIAELSKGAEAAGITADTIKNFLSVK